MSAQAGSRYIERVKERETESRAACKERKYAHYQRDTHGKQQK